MLIELGTLGPEATELVDCRTVRAFERELFATGEATSAGLMEIAAAGVVEAIEHTWPKLAPGGDGFPGSAVVLCGPGLNGGDGYLAAWLLHEKGWRVEVIALGDHARQPREASDARERLIEAGLEIKDALDALGILRACSAASFHDVAIDAILGSGARHPMPEEWRETLAAVAQDSRYLVCVNGHSALDLDTGVADATAPVADLTVTFHRPRPGHVIGQGPLLSGRVMVAGLGLESEWAHYRGAGSPRAQSFPRLWSRHVAPGAELAKKPFQHKYDHGHALILSGEASHGGAARLAARAALRVGAGLVTLGLPDAAGMASATPDALMRRVISTPADLVAALDDARIRSLCLGPGLGIARARGLVEAALKHPRSRGENLSFVLDADALTAFADDPQALFTLTSGCKAVLTPHAGEFARLFPDAASRKGTSLIEHARDAASAARCVMLHKGGATVVTEGSGEACVIAAWDAPWLATAGSGDVLSGIIAGLLARGFSPFEAATTGAWLHAAAARRFGPGLIADDLPEQLPGVFRDMGL